MSPSPDPAVSDKSLVEMWREVADSLEFRHADPGVRVTVEVYAGYDHEVVLRFNTHGVMDTDTVYRARINLASVTCVHEWPGREAAELVLLGAWMMYVQHETLELVRRRGVSDKAPWHPHGYGEMSALVSQPGRSMHDGTMPLVEIAATAVGREAAARTFECCRCRQHEAVRNGTAPPRPRLFDPGIDRSRLSLDVEAAMSLLPPLDFVTDVEAPAFLLPPLDFVTKE